MPILMLLLLVQAAQLPPVFRAGSTIVRVDAQVLDHQDRVIEGLGKDDFLVFEDGKRQPLVQFVPEDGPLDLLLLIDKSGSMLPVTAELALSAVETLTVLRPPDRVGVMLFDAKTSVLAALTPVTEEVVTALEGAVREEHIGGGTNINRAVLDAALYMRQQPRTEARRAILILTDNQSAKTVRDRTVVRELWEADTVLDGLIFESTMDVVAERYGKATQPLRLLLDADVKGIVDKTGGEWRRASLANEPFRRMLERIKKRYTLYYRPPAGPAGKARSIQVELSPKAMKKYPAAKIRYRRGYIPKEGVQ